MKKVLVVGKQGQLAQALACCQPTELNVCYLGRADFAPMSEEKLQELLGVFSPDILINAAAWTDVEQAELKKAQCSSLNTELVVWLIRCAAQSGIPLIHISTDYVFDGQASQPYTEQAQVAPLNHYGVSKAEAERCLLRDYPELALILRTSWLYSGFGSNFLVKMLAILQKPYQGQIPMVADQWGSPTSALDLAGRIWQLVMQPFQPGLYHYAGAECVSRFEFATLIAERMLKAGLLVAEPDFYPVELNAFPAMAERPVYSCLDSSLLLRRQGWSQTSLQSDIDQELKLLLQLNKSSGRLQPE